MKIVVIGGAGRVGSDLVQRLRRQGHELVAASRRTGVDVITGQGLSEALEGADLAVDVTNSPSFEDEAALRFFETATQNILAAEKAVGVTHHIALSIVGAERLRANGYFRAKFLQEEQVQAAGQPCTVLRATQFYEFLPAIVEACTDGGEIRVAPAHVQPIAASDVAEALANLVQVPPVGATIELAGPDMHRLDQIIGRFMAASADNRPILVDPQALYFGAPLADETLMAGSVPRFGHTEFDGWLRRWTSAHAVTN